MDSTYVPTDYPKRPKIDEKVDALESRVVLLTSGSSIYDDAYKYREYKGSREEDPMFIDTSISELGFGQCQYLNKYVA